MKKCLGRILVTAGPTQEMLDPVRYLTNRSTGEMGYAIARAAHRAGYEVTLISGPVSLKPPSGVQLVSITSAAQLKRECERHFKRCHILFMTAAVCDFRPAVPKAKKIHRQGHLTLELKKTPDILASLGAQKKDRILIGFCLETEDWLARARKKMERKNLNGIVANTLTPLHNPFGRRKIQVALLDREGQTQRMPARSKSEIARGLVRWAEKMIARNPS